MTATLCYRPPTAVAPPTGWGRLRLVLVLGALIALGPLTIDMYLPALPTIVDDLGTTSAAVQLTLTGTLVGLALGQLLVGPLSDTFGRRRPLLVGVGVHVAGVAAVPGGAERRRAGRPAGAAGHRCGGRRRW